MKKSSKQQNNPIVENKLNFPEIKGKMLPPSIRSIDEINSLIEEDYALFFNREQYDQEKKKMAVYVKFVL